MHPIAKSRKPYDIGVKFGLAIEPIIGHHKDDHLMRRCHLKGSDGDALHAVLCAAGYVVGWMLRMIARLRPVADLGLK